MRTIDMHTWPRRRHFALYKDFANPHFNLCASVDIAAFRALLKERALSFSVAIVYLLARVANEIPEFRYRIRGAEVVEHEVVHPSTTVLTAGDLFSFCTIRYSDDFPTFAARATEMIALVRANPTLEDEPGRDDLLFMTGIPWVSFTGLQHPIRLGHVDSVPRIAWGKFAPAGERLQMPLSVQAHHALMDGIHVGRYFSRVQEYLDQPHRLLSLGPLAPAD